MKKWAVISVYLIMLTLAFIYRNQLMAWLQGAPSSWLLLFLSILLALFPVVPYKVVIAAAGYMMGTWTGSVIILAGSTLAGVIVYGIAALFRETTANWLARYNKLEQMNQLFTNHPFRTIVICRLIPILPQAVVNLYAGTTGMSLTAFILGSLAGKLPAVFTYAYVGSSLDKEPVKAVIIATAYFVLLFILLLGYRRSEHRNKAV